MFKFQTHEKKIKKSKESEWKEKARKKKDHSYFFCFYFLFLPHFSPFCFLISFSLFFSFLSYSPLSISLWAQWSASKSQKKRKGEVSFGWDMALCSDSFIEPLMEQWQIFFEGIKLMNMWNYVVHKKVRTSFYFRFIFSFVLTALTLVFLGELRTSNGFPKVWSENLRSVKCNCVIVKWSIQCFPKCHGPLA